MKVRWNRSSLRLRITPSEMETVIAGASVAESLALPGGSGWRVTLNAGTETVLGATADGVTVSLSAADRDILASPAAEGVYLQSPYGLRYYVEKDFPCAHPRAAEALEPTAQTFEAPPGFEQRKNSE